MSLGRPGARILAVAVGVVSGCSTDVTLPGDALVGCDTASDCPSGLICHLGLCVAPGSIDTTPPDLAGAPVVAPASGRAGTTFTVDLGSTEPLLEPPEVTLSLVPPVAVPCAASGGGYRCSYVASGDENGGLGGIVAFDVRLRDRARNETLRKLAGALHLDFTPPALAAASVEPPSARLGGLVQVFLAASEPLLGSPVLVASRPLDQGGGGQARFPLSPQPGTLNYAFAHLVTPADPLGDVAFTLEAVDLAGNAATLEVGSLAIDNLLPALGPVSVSPARIDGTGTVNVGFEVSEPASRLSVTIGGRAASCGPFQPTTGAAGSYACSRPMVGDEIPAGTEAPQSVVVEVEDGAGNRATGGGSLTFDFRPPALTLATVGYVPAPGNPLGAVGAAAAGTRIRVAVVADEALASVPAPAITASLAGTSLPFALVPGTLTGTGATLEAVVPPGAPDGDYAPLLTWTDVAGNEASVGFASPAIRVKTSTPTLTVDQDGIVFVRSPWGNAAPEDLGGFTLPAGPYFAIAPADPLSTSPRLPSGTFLLGGGAAPSAVLVRLTSDPGSLALGTLRPDGLGTWPRQALASPDVPTVHVAGVDEAGNVSVGVPLLNAEWVATANAPALGSSPHALTRLGVVEPSRSQTLDATPALGPDAGGADRAAVLARAQVAWIERAPPNETAPAPRSGATMAFDAARGRTVLFGGTPGLTTFQDTWERDGSAWRDVTPAGAKPPGRDQAAMDYDARRGCVVLFGGLGTDDQLADTWEWDGATWREVTPPGPSPVPRNGHALAFDQARGRMLLFGGFTADTWEWDGASWREVTPAGPGPTARYGTALAHDPARGRTVLFGGIEGATGGMPLDTWEWDGTGWHDVTPAAPGPSSRMHHRLVFDARRGRILLVGGMDPVTSGALQDVWEWDGTSWREVTPAAGPPPRSSHAMAFDAARGRVVVHGGSSSAGLLLGDTWELDGGRWREVTPAAVPAGRREHALAYDEARGRVVLFGGQDAALTDLQDTWEWDGTRWWDVTPAGASPAPRMRHALVHDGLRHRTVLFGGRNGAGDLFQDTWEWDGTRWWDVTPAGASPAPRMRHALVHDGLRHRTVLFGGRNDAGDLFQDTWEWDGSTWTEVTPAGPSPSPRYTAMAYDGLRGRTVLFGGSDAPADTWEWDGSSWQEVTPAGASPPPRERHAMAFDAARGRVVLFGGRDLDLYQDTWEWDGAAWREVTPAGPSPSPRWREAMAYDSARGRVVLFGGGVSVGPGTLQDAWEWDGAAWAEVTPDGPVPSARVPAGMAYDAARGRMVLFGGYGSGFLQDTWELTAHPGRQPAIQLDVAIGGAGISPAAIDRVQVRAFAGGAFSQGAPGATLLGWSTDLPGAGPGWLELATNSTGVAPSPPYLPAPPATLLAWQSGTPAEGLRLLTERDGRLSFQVRPSGAAGTEAGGALVALDSIEVRVRYRTQ
jgi:hypothetical protein